MRWMMAAAWRQVTLLALCMIAAAPVHAVEEEAHVLILNGLDPYLPAYIVIDGAMRASLANERTRRVVVFSESLDAQRFPQALEPEFPALLAKRYGALRIDVVVVVSQVALEFFKRHSELWPGARVVYVGFPGEAIGPPALPTNATGVVAHVDVAGTIDLALRLQPDAHRIVVVSGAGDGDQRAERLARQVLSMRGEQELWSTSPDFRSPNWLLEWLRSQRKPLFSISRSSATEMVDRTRPRRAACDQRQIGRACVRGNLGGCGLATMDRPVGWRRA
jgi:hypothetical protein